MLTEYKMPALSKPEDDTQIEYTIGKILKKPGDLVAEGEEVLEVETVKANKAIESEHTGIIETIVVREGQEGIVAGDLLFTVRVAVEPEVAAPTTIVQPPEQLVQAELPPEPLETAAVLPPVSKPNLPKPKSPLPITPLAQEIANICSIEISDIEIPPGSLRIGSKMVLDVIKKRLSAVPVSSLPALRLPDFFAFGSIRREKMSGIAKATAKNMQAAWSNVPHAWLMEKADLTALETFRGTHKEAVKQAGGSLTVTVIVAKAVAGLLRKFPRVNASVDMTAQEIVFKDFIHIGIAVDTEHGLFVPVIRDCDRKNMAEIGAELLQLSSLAKDKKLPPENMEGGTFTITNVGGIGGTSILPIVNAPQAAILGMTAAQTEMVWNPEKQAAEPRPLMQMTLGFDHRLVNGGEAARFLRQLKAILETPELMLVV